MKLAIMQPYFFPYAGYFRLVSMVDKFVFYDDVKFIKGGWINRNRIIISGMARYVTVPVVSASTAGAIERVRIRPRRLWLRKMLTSIRQGYSKSPNFRKAFDLIRDVLDSDSDSLAELARDSVEKVSQRIGLEPRFSSSSGMYENEHLSGVDRVIDICSREHADVYVNLPGGKHLYDPGVFAGKGIQLQFVDVKLKEYVRGRAGFIGGLSIIDTLMFNSFDEVKDII